MGGDVGKYGFVVYILFSITHICNECEEEEKKNQTKNKQTPAYRHRSRHCFLTNFNITLNFPPVNKINLIFCTLK